MSEDRQIWFSWDGARMRAVHPNGLTARLAVAGLYLLVFAATMFVSIRNPALGRWIVWTPPAVLLGGFALMWRRVR